MGKKNNNYKADFLWPYEEGSVQEAGYAFVNANTEEGRMLWWKKILERKENNGQ